MPTINPCCTPSTAPIALQSLKIGIVGAGLVGRLTALALHRQGHHIVLFDQDDKEGKSSSAYAAAGLLTPLSEAFHADHSIVRMGFDSLALWPDIIAQLDDHVFFQQTGSIIVSHKQDQDDFQRHHGYLKQHFGHHDIQLLDRQGLLVLEPELGRSFNQGLFLPEEGQLGNRRLLKALTTQLTHEGIDWRTQCNVTRLSSTSSVQRTALVEYQNNKGETHKLGADLIIDCRGIGACSTQQTHQMHSSMVLNDLRAVRGELFQLYAPQVNLTRPIRLIHPRYQLYIAPKTHGYFVVGATEIESHDRSPMTVRSALELLSAAYSIHPGFGEANIRQQVSHCRPAFSDNKPQVIAHHDIIHVNGLYRHGFLIAPSIVEQIKALVAQHLNGNQTIFTQMHEKVPS